MTRPVGRIRNESYNDSLVTSVENYIFENCKNLFCIAFKVCFESLSLSKRLYVNIERLFNPENSPVLFISVFNVYITRFVNLTNTLVLIFCLFLYLTMYV